MHTDTTFCGCGANRDKSPIMVKFKRTATLPGRTLHARARFPGVGLARLRRDGGTQSSDQGHPCTPAAGRKQASWRLRATADAATSLTQLLAQASEPSQRVDWQAPLRHHAVWLEPGTGFMPMDESQPTDHRQAVHDHEPNDGTHVTQLFIELDGVEPPRLRCGWQAPQANIVERGQASLRHGARIEASRKNLNDQSLLDMQGSISQAVQLPAWRHPVESLQAHGRTAAHRYWQTYLDGLDIASHAGLPLESPHADGARTPALHEQALEALMLPAEITARLTRLSRVESVGLATVMLAAWGLLLCTCNAEPEVLFGYTTSGRLPEPEHSGSPGGGRINPLPLRLKITGDDRLGSWLREIQRHQLDHEAHGHLALADIQQCAGMRAEQLLFHNLVVVRHVTVDPLPWSGDGSLPFGAAIPGTGQSSIPLTLVIFPGEHLKLELVYRRALFSAAAIQALLARLGQLLTRFARGGTQRLAWLSPSTEGEWNSAMSMADDMPIKFKPASTGAGSL